MDLIHYADGSVLTGTDIARALVDYAQALAGTNSSASIDIPSRESDGSVGRANFLLGPASQMVSVSIPDNGAPEIEDAEVVEDLRSRTERLQGYVVRSDEQRGEAGVPTFPDLEEFEPPTDAATNA